MGDRTGLGYTLEQAITLCFQIAGEEGQDAQQRATETVVSLLTGIPDHEVRDRIIAYALEDERE